MSRHILSLSPEQLTVFDLNALITHAEAFNQHHRETFTTPFPKAPSRWRSHYEFAPQPIELTALFLVAGVGFEPTTFRL